MPHDDSQAARVTPPTCPHCGESLEEVLDLPYGYWEWDGFEYKLRPTVCSTRPGRRVTGTAVLSARSVWAGSNAPSGSPPARHVERRYGDSEERKAGSALAATWEPACTVPRSATRTSPAPAAAKRCRVASPGARPSASDDRPSLRSPNP